MVSCLSGLDPLPDKIEDLTMSLSIPVGKIDVLKGATTPGLPYNRLNIPDWARYDALYYTDTVTVDLSKIYESSSISYLAFNLNMWNEFPVACTANLSFANSEGVILYTFNPLDIIKGSILFNGNVVNPGYSKASVVFDSEQIKNLETAEYLIFNVKLKIKDGNTNDFQYYDSFKLTCHLGARVDFILNNI